MRALVLFLQMALVKTLRINLVILFRLQAHVRCWMFRIVTKSGTCPQKGNVSCLLHISKHSSQAYWEGKRRIDEKIIDFHYL